MNTPEWTETELANASAEDRKALWKFLKHTARGQRDAQVRRHMTTIIELMAPDVSSDAGGWELLRAIDLSWSRSQPGITEVDDPGFKVAAVALGGLLGIAPGTIDHVSLTPTNEQPAAFKVSVGGRWGGREMRTYAAAIAAAWDAAEVDLVRDPAQVRPATITVFVSLRRDAGRIRSTTATVPAATTLEDVRTQAFESFLRTGAVTGSIEDWVVCDEAGNRLRLQETVGRLAEDRVSIGLALRPRVDFDALDEVTFDFGANTKRGLVRLYLGPGAKMEDVFRQALVEAGLDATESRDPSAWEWVSDSTVAFRWLMSWTWKELRDAVFTNGREPPRLWTVRRPAGVGG